MNGILASNFRSRIVGIYGFLVAVNIGAWVWAIIAFHEKPVLLGTAVLAYTLVFGTPSMPTTLQRSTTSLAS